MEVKYKKRRKQAVEFKELEEVGRQLGIVAGILASAGVIWKFVVEPFRKAHVRNVARDTAIASLTTSCCDLKTSIVELNTKLSGVQTTIDDNQEASIKIRKNLYHGQIATISALRELAAHEGLTINGPVQLYYEQNIEALKKDLNCEDT